MKLVHFSDWHGQEMLLPAADLYICTGDMLSDYPLPDGTLNYRRQIFLQAKEIATKNYTKLLSNPKAPVIVCRGNHDFVSLRGLFPNAYVKEMRKEPSVAVLAGVQICGVRGVPKTTGYHSDELSMPEQFKLFRNMPGDNDILVTHTPPYRVLDNGLGSDALRYYLSDKSKPFASGIEQRLKLHCFGHIHEQFGFEHRVLHSKKIYYSNAATGWRLLDFSAGEVNLIKEERLK